MADDELAKAKVGIGNIPITLAGNEYNLVPTLNAAQGISRSAAGLRGSMEAIMRMDVDQVVRVIQLGLGPRVVKDLGGVDKLPELIYQSGMTDTSGGIIAKCIEYITVLTNGGKPLNPKKDEDEGENPN